MQRFFRLALADGIAFPDRDKRLCHRHTEVDPRHAHHFRYPDCYSCTHIHADALAHSHPNPRSCSHAFVNTRAHANAYRGADPFPDPCPPGNRPARSDCDACSRQTHPCPHPYGYPGANSTPHPTCSHCHSRSRHCCRAAC